MDNSQQFAVELFEEGANLFITGGAGVGKSHFIRTISKSNPFKPVIITSTTGISAMLVGGRTIHSWSGVGMFDESKPFDVYFQRIKKNKYLTAAWKSTKCLVIDEISMMHPAFLDLLNNLAKTIRANNKPFGGIQLILVGDFYQLPPILNKDDETKINSEQKDNKNKKHFCFESSCWNELNLVPVCFTHIYRQNEKDLMDVLNKVRIGNIDTQVVSYLQDLTKNKPTDELYTHVYPTKRKVSEYNQLMLDKLPDDIREFKAKVNFKSTFNTTFFNFPKDTLIDETLKIKKGCFVMCIFNIDFDSGIVNGSQGIIEDFHKNNGYPIVKFSNGVTRVMEPHTWQFEGFSIEQIPLIVAYSVTVHKMQGSSIEKLTIDIGKHIFECGQSYVALSRCTNSKHLHVASFSPEKIRVNEKVSEFYKNTFNLKN